jgi:Leucine-rich repeat (LRR) protein
VPAVSSWDLCFMQDNRLTSIDGLGCLSRLQRLELGSNKLSSLEALSGLTALQLLSVEDNQLEGLAGLEALTSLMELYAAGVHSQLPLPRLLDHCTARL